MANVPKCGKCGKPMVHGEGTMQEIVVPEGEEHAGRDAWRVIIFCPEPECRARNIVIWLKMGQPAPKKT